MKKTLIYLFLFFILINLFFSLVLAENTSDTEGNLGQGDIAGDVEKIQNLTDQLPFDDNGQIDKDKTGNLINGSKTKAEQRIEELNKYIGPVSLFLFGVPLSLSWTFAFSVLIFIIIFDFAFEPLKDGFGMKPYLAVIAGAIIAIICMHSFGEQFEALINMIIGLWWGAILAIIFGTLIFTFVVYPIIWKYVGKMREAQKLAEVERSKSEINQFANQTRKAGEDLAKS
jgi:uncharacterized membrane protein